jgi:hypothetical protein
MDRVHRASQVAFERLRSAAIAVREIDPQQRHIGLLYSDNGLNRVSFLHLAWHFDLRCEAPRTEYFWVDPAIPTPRLVQLAAVCRLVWRANGKGRIPYGFGPPADCLDSTTGEYLFGPAGSGLTCATFVLAAFRRAGLPLLRYETWPIGRAGDSEWQTRIVAALASTPGTITEHADAVRRDVGTTVRFRPEEVAGAATVATIPVDFAVAEAHAAQLLLRLREPS